MKRYVVLAVIVAVWVWAWIDAGRRFRPQELPVMATPSGSTRVLWLAGERER